MTRPEVIDIGEHLIPDGSLAVSAAEVRLGSNDTTIVELFEDSTGRSFDFRGLPNHLADGDAMWIEVTTPLSHDPSGHESIDFANRRDARRRQERLLFEFAIGARQRLWDGAEVRYADESYDPTSRHYKIS